MNYLKPATASSFVRSQAYNIHQLWTENLKDVMDVTHPLSRQIYLDALHDLYERAAVLMACRDPTLDQISSAQLSHILSRSIEAHISLARK